MIIPENILRLMSPADRQRCAKGLLTAQEAAVRAIAGFEKKEQRILANWLLARKNDCILTYNWSATHRRTTNRPGTPDFMIYREGRFLAGEMKVEGGRFSEAQKLLHAEFANSGTQVEIWTSADMAIKRVKNWLWSEFKLWQPQQHGPAD